MTDLRGYNLKLTGTTTMITETCYACGTLFAMTEDFRAHRLRDRKNFYCPCGHSQRYVGKTDTERLKEAQVRETALKDQAYAAAKEAEALRGALLRDRTRFANGVCPCCNRSFENVKRHMSTQHPDYDVTKIEAHGPAFGCSCGRSFETLAGLHRHQTAQRGEDWYLPSAGRWSSHLTKV